VRDEPPEELPYGPAWRCGDVVLKPVDSAAQAAWVAETLGALDVPDLRVARPLRSSDGRWVVSGWSAVRYVSGAAEPRTNDIVEVSFRLHAATAVLRRPRFLSSRDDLLGVADAVAWGEREPDELAGIAADGDLVVELADLAAARGPENFRPQVVHGDLFGTVLFAGAAPPAIIDFVPFWRPAEWAAAVVVVDALAWGGASPDLLSRWSGLAEWPRVLLRALLFRVVAHALHPQSTAESGARLRQAVALVRDFTSSR